MNKVNLRKEFFRLSIHQLREFVAEMNLEASFTIAAEAREYRETMAFEKMTPEEKRRSTRLEKRSLCWVRTDYCKFECLSSPLLRLFVFHRGSLSHIESLKHLERQSHAQAPLAFSFLARRA
jgi:hypothetical protein